jgi:hypothetical protein
MIEMGARPRLLTSEQLWRRRSHTKRRKQVKVSELMSVLARGGLEDQFLHAGQGQVGNEDSRAEDPSLPSLLPPLKTCLFVSDRLLRGPLVIRSGPESVDLHDHRAGR